MYFRGMVVNDDYNSKSQSGFFISVLDAIVYMICDAANSVL